MEPKDNPTIAQSEDSCEYCLALKKINDPEEGECPYCVDMESKKDPIASCKYCADSKKLAENEDCKYCAREIVEEPVLENPEAGDLEESEGGAYEGENTLNNVLLDEQNEPHHKPAPVESVLVDQSTAGIQAIVDQIDDTKEAQPSDKETAQQIEEADLTPGDEVVNGVSRPSGFESNVPGDMGLGAQTTNQSPDLSSVLSEGLDYHSETIKKEKVLSMVQEALVGFKACKPILYKAKEQAPQLYGASLSMLKAMIEMAKLLGLEEKPASPEMGQEVVQEQTQPENEWYNPFPKHPDHQTEAEKSLDLTGKDSKDGKGSQQIGILPTSATTPHVRVNETLPDGAVNQFGQKKFVDPATGKISFIDMKTPRVLNSAGKPVTGR